MQLHEKYGEEGFIILAITAADSLDAVAARSEAEKWGINYRVVEDKGRKITDLFGVSSFPTSYIVQPDGTIMPGGHVPSAEQVPDMLKDVVLFKRPADLPKSLAKAGAAFDAGAFGQAYKAASKVKEKGEEDAAVATELCDIIDKKLAKGLEQVDKAVEKQDFVGAIRKLDRLTGELDGCELAKTCKTKRDELEKAHSEPWRGAEAYLALEAKVAETKRDKDKAKLAPAFRALAQKYGNTPLATQAARRATELEGL